ncbi:MAG: hypothetical protein LBG52_07695 [Candidatus Peribacteria bacterium]|jgi:hypothetical protein|nr:hypothetical protein [Candidatus Peribacteria bacterium]
MFKRHQLHQARLREFAKRGRPAIPSDSDFNKSFEGTSLQSADSKEMLSKSPSVSTYLSALIQGEEPNAEWQERWQNIGKKGSLQAYLEGRRNLPYKGFDGHEGAETFFTNGELHDCEGFAVRLAKQGKPESEIQTIITQTQQFSPDTSTAERKGRGIFKKNTRELYTIALGRAVDHIKAYLDTTVENSQGNQYNFSEVFSLQDAKSLEIQDGKLVIRGTINHTPISFFYDLATGEISTNAIIGKEPNRESFSLHNEQRRVLLTKLRPFSEVVQISRDFLRSSRDDFKQLQQIKDINKQYEKREAIKEQALSSLVTRTQGSTKEDFATMIEKNQTMQSFINVFQLHFPSNTIEKSQQPYIYHLFELLEQSITSLDDAQKAKKCLELLTTQANIHHKIQ